MDAHVKAIVRDCTEGSDQERMTFPEVVTKLIGAGVERYHTDMLRGEKTYYLPNGESEIVRGASVASKPPMAFSAAGVEAAVRAIQAQKIKYKEFCERIVAAGCVGYFVSMAGRQAVYYGRTGDSYVEPFPAAK